MPRKLLRRYLPDQAQLQENRVLRRFAHWFEHPNYWHLNRRSVAGGLAAGMLGGLIPGPLQIITASLLAWWWRVNLPVAVLGTFYTNPLTIGPLYWLAFTLGSWVTGQDGVATMAQMPSLWQLGLWDWLLALPDWLAALGAPLLVGLPLLGILLALGAFVLVQLGWRLSVYRSVAKRNQRVQANTEGGYKKAN
ncbi:DUF2062 domain-containing protein [Chitinibacter sp. ZOR0017]|uniref:DUF2062 domain-containing protein n=1 Tax=Chitinibacter sp. ZOR0017 TaxID=1339254 RepID=UPI000647A15F|nr:DUF2062 domain-containing protein [Chitinibacter sp. ZOR0017]